MGLDTIEIVMETEQRFGVHLPDEECSQVRTVGELHALVLRKLHVPVGSHCLSAAAYYRLRRALVELLGLERRVVRPKLVLASVVPVGKRRELWAHLSSSLGLKLPALRRPVWLESLLLMLSVGTTFMIFAAPSLVIEAVEGSSAASWVLFAWGATAIATAVATLSTRPLAVGFQNAVTVGDLSHRVCAMNAGKLARSVGHVNPREVWQQLVELVSEQVGIRVQDITSESRFVEDLNCG